jgi:hypothetical protein
MCYGAWTALNATTNVSLTNQVMATFDDSDTVRTRIWSVDRLGRRNDDGWRGIGLVRKLHGHGYAHLFVGRY